jgi:hypothetical protein
MVSPRTISTDCRGGGGVDRILSDRGTEYCGARDRHEYELYLAVEDIDHTRTKVKSPQTNAICERFRVILRPIRRRRRRIRNFATLGAIPSRPRPVASRSNSGGRMKAHRPARQPDLHLAEQGSRPPAPRVQRYALADRLHLPEGDRLGVVLSFEHPRRLLALYHRLGALHHDRPSARWRVLWRRNSPLHAATRCVSDTNRACYPITVPVTSRPTSQNG